MKFLNEVLTEGLCGVPHSTFKFLDAWNFKGKVNECYSGVSKLMLFNVYSCKDVTLVIFAL